MRDRQHPALRFELAPGRPWAWAGPGGPVDAALADLLAAASYARIVRLPGREAIDLAAIRAAHEHAADAALQARNSDLAHRLVHEQAEVTSPALVGEEEAAKLLGIGVRTLHNYRLVYRSICPPVLITGGQRTHWLWAPGQFAAWQQSRPGKGWRRGRTGAQEASSRPER
jgi:hypothetical protein